MSVLVHFARAVRQSPQYDFKRNLINLIEFLEEEAGKGMISSVDIVEEELTEEDCKQICEDG